MTLPLCTRAQSTAFDAAAIDAGVPGIVLMENAGRGAAEVVRAELDRLPAGRHEVVCIGGTGNNGGDAWVVARHLVRQQLKVRAILVGSSSALTGDASIAFEALRAVGVEVREVAPGPIPLDGASLIVDGLFGTGLSRPIEGGFAEVVESIVRAAGDGTHVVALDLPSGVDADTGQVLGVAVRADCTVTFAARKRGLTQYPGRALAGRVVVADIGVPAPIVDQASIIEDSDLMRWVPARAADAHKGIAGRVLVAGGSPGKTGAGILAGWGALRGGAGLVTIATKAQAAIDAKVVELMTRPLGSAEELLEQIDQHDAAVIGPGLGLSANSADRVREALTSETPLVLDADALTHIAKLGEGGFALLKNATAIRVLTPHPGEAARLLGTTSAEVQADRFGAAETLAQKCGQVVLLKGAGSIVVDPRSDHCRVCVAGTPALAVGGTGDVLAGLVGALLACGVSAYDAASAAAQLCARAGELAAVGDRGVRAREVADRIPHVLAAVLSRGSQAAAT